jgi:hypothetical protein
MCRVTARPDPQRLGSQCLDQAFAHEVAARFLDVRSTPHDPVVAAAYELLEAQTDRLFVMLTRPSAAAPFRVVFSAGRVPYESDVEMIAAVRATRVLEIASVADDRDRQHPLLDSSRGGAYDRFRAVHDLIGHVRYGYGFDRHGEFAAWLAQDRLHSGPARRALATELHAENSVLWTTGTLAEHKAALLPTQVLDRARRGSFQRGGDAATAVPRSSP